MGVCLSCCPPFSSPEGEGRRDSAQSAPATSADTAPLMSHDMSAAVVASKSSLDGLPNAGSLPQSANVVVGGAVDAEQAVFARILQESANQMIDCTAIGPAKNDDSSKNAVAEAAANAATEKANVYGRRLAAAANALIAKHLDLSDDLGQALGEQRHAENELENEENSVLATEVALKASETVDSRLEVPTDLVVNFASTSDENEDEQDA